MTHFSTCRRAVSVLFAASLALAASGASAAQQTPALDDGLAPLTFGIVPQQSASRLAKMWGPVLHELGRQIGRPIRFQTTRDIPTFEACLAAGAYDLAYMNPVHYTIFSRRTGYRAIAHQTEKRLRGLLVVRKDSPYQSIDDLSGTAIAFPSPGAFGASVLPRAELRGRSVRFTPNYVRSHDSVYRAVAAGLMPAGGGVLRTFNAADPALRDQLRVIYRTQAYTPHAIAANAGLPDEMRTRIVRILISLRGTRPQLLEAIGMNGFETASDEDWNDVRALGLSTEETGITTTGDAVCPSG